MRFDWSPIHGPLSSFLSSFASYDVADWIKLGAAVVGGIGTTYGFWKAYRYSKAQIAQRLIEYLGAHEQHILESRKALLRRLDFGDTIEKVVLHGAIERAFTLVNNAHFAEASSRLEHLQQLLMKSAQVGERHRDIAHRQAATVLLFMGMLAGRNHNHEEARKHIQRALDISKTDADVLKQIGKLEFELGNKLKAQQYYSAAFASADGDQEMMADTSRLMALLHRSNRRPRLEKSALDACAPIFWELKRWSVAAECYVRLGELQRLRGPAAQVAVSDARAIEGYERAGDLLKADGLRSALGLPDRSRTVRGVRAEHIWQWLRLTTEITIVLCGFFMLVSRT